MVEEQEEDEDVEMDGLFGDGDYWVKLNNGNYLI